MASSPELSHEPSRRVSSTISEPSFRESDRRVYWASFIALSSLVLTAESAVVIIYGLLAPSSAHRIAIIAISSIGTVGALAIVAFSRRLARRPWRSGFVFTSTLIAGVLLAACIDLDGGIDSPLIYLSALPVMSAALTLPTMKVAVCGLAALAEFSAATFAVPRIDHSPADSFVLFAFLVGVIALAVVAAHSRTDLQVKEESGFNDLARLAETDPLTGCLNHGAFYARPRSEVDRSLRFGYALSLIVGDIDLFKAFNDTYGHTAGDNALVELGEVLMSAVRSSDVVARIGGDEFAVILPETPLGNNLLAGPLPLRQGERRHQYLLAT